jgi:predicted O-methyltransferase YrrM
MTAASNPTSAADARRFIAELGAEDDIQRIVDEAPPLPDDAIDMLRRLNVPVGHHAEAEETA